MFKTKVKARRFTATLRFVFYNNESIQKLAFFRFLECSLRKANDLFAAQIILARQNLHFLT
jgi:hypothetical protein